MGAWLSECETFRYALWRIWEKAKPVLLVSMLNPSTADHRKDDPTIIKVCKFARREGYGGVLVVNGYAFRATSPKDLKANGFMQGPMNEYAIRQASEHASTVLLAHGANMPVSRQKQLVDTYLSCGLDIVCLGRTKDGFPCHPLYRLDVQPFEVFC